MQSDLWSVVFENVEVVRDADGMLMLRVGEKAVSVPVRRVLAGTTIARQGDRGRLVLYGILREIRREHSGRALVVGGDGDWGAFESVEKTESAGTKTRVSLREGRGAREFLMEATARGAIPDSYESAEASLEEIFVKVVEGRS